MMKKTWKVILAAGMACTLSHAAVINVTNARNVQDDWTGTQGTSSLGALSLPVAIQNQVSGTGILAYTIEGLDLNGIGGNDDSVNISFNVAADKGNIVTGNGVGDYLSDAGSVINATDEGLVFSFASLSVNVDGGTGNGSGSFDGFSGLYLTSFKVANGDQADVNGDTITAANADATEFVSLSDVSSIDMSYIAGNGVRVEGFDFQVTAIPEPATLGLIAAFGGSLLFIRRLMM